ncbi:MAG: hypothetical protein AYK22_01025 [Thermoplasmatales archaeon SG8-52-3]|nr:MAG: hypothetical protein AYK22_01025 [Thermoplasmatales archaeon SG8-52-3]
MEKKLIPENELFDIEKITKNLRSKIIGKKIHYFKKISSTNSYAKKLIKEFTDEGTIVVADVQTQGRGRKNRLWHSPFGGLWFSIILYPDLPPESGMLITMAVSISVAQAIKETTGMNAKIKWPNDLLIRNKKVSGILTELDASSYKINYAIIGIGINVNNKINDELKTIACSLKQENNKDISRIKIFISILENFDFYYDKLKNKDLDFIKKTWLSFTNILNKKIQVTENKKVIEGVFLGINDLGHLILDTKFGEIKIITGDIKYL